MKIQFALSKIAQGVFNCDTAMEYLESKELNVTEELYEELKAAEAAYLSAKHWPQPDDIVLVAGQNGNPDFKANYRGKEFGRAIVVPERGMQISVELDRLSKIPA